MKLKKLAKRCLRKLHIYVSEEYRHAVNEVDSGINYYNKTLFNASNQKIIFIHIPKAAGISIVKALYDRTQSCHAAAVHYREENPKLFDSATKITLVRNPYSRLISAYNYLQDGGRCEIDEVWRERYIAPYKSINHFVQHGLEKAIQDNAEHFIPQYQFIYDKDELLVDHIGRVEEINEFESFVKTIVDRPFNITKNNASKGDASIDVLTKASIEVINKLYGQDFEKLNYQAIIV
ncbi:sulfotransferase family 2 domain-containing protein [Alteromonas sp. KUL49]|uniref:sulfotransferase family 2 domain-containing protein n=1 Tax=Alteromonas sp. KUL49 TaxID=2480798 RepID=UPI00102EEDF9|nr:sulfotransferase family 2 domain-containing protein [Alteromonas sp. KUL49]TAP41440.1 hypothetical protein EYS00_04440 [Alteromonas sp. KUL49]GEA10517.1 hypothetical protein KUL49_08920 [Alteromonas sp. KUL49]